jgi:double-stranded uracil-DNA glycosylase
VAAAFGGMAGNYAVMEEVESQEEAAERLLEHVVVAAGLIDAERRAAVGVPAERLADLADEEDAELIVVGSRGRGAFKSAFLGSVSNSLVGVARCPVELLRSLFEDKLDSRNPKQRKSDVPDVLAPGLTAVFCGINPGRFSAAANAHFANPRNDFWRLLYAAGFTPRLYDPSEQFDLLQLGIGVTNAAYRTTPGSGDLRRGDFAGSAERLERMALELKPGAIGFVGKEAYRGAFGERAELGAQERRIGETTLWVLPSTSPANAAVSWAERLRWFVAFQESL